MNDPTIAVVMKAPPRSASDPPYATLRRWLSETGIALSDVAWVYLLPEPSFDKTPEPKIKEGLARAHETLGGMPALETVIAVGAEPVRLDADLWRGGILKCHGHAGEIGIRDMTTGTPGGDVFRRAHAIAIYHPSFFLRQKETRRRVEIEGSC